MRVLAVALVSCFACGHDARVDPAQPPSPAPAVPVAPAPQIAPVPAGVVDLGSKLESIRAERKLPALALAYWRGDKLVAIGATGLRKAGDPAHPVTIDDRWHLGSDTKAMTATLVGIFVDRGVLHWDDTIGKLFAGEKIDRGYANVTIDQLLQHRGGVPGVAPRDAWRQFKRDRTAPNARLELVRAVLAQPPAQAIGTYEYANEGYVTLGVILERATGKTWEQLMQDELFTPLVMTHCGFGPPGDARAIDQPWGHSSVLGRPLAPDDPSADLPPGRNPAGGVNCSLADWGKFLAMFAGTGRSVVTAATLAHLQTAPDAPGEHYMAGWRVVQIGGRTMLEHIGSNENWYAIAMVFPAAHVAIAVAANRMDRGLETAMLPVIASLAQP